MSMTKRQAQNYARLRETLAGMGIGDDDIESLLRIERTLHRWAERECNGEVEVDDDGKAWSTVRGTMSTLCGLAPVRIATANREAGALKRLAAIMDRYPELLSYHQRDPRGCALYVYRLDRMLDDNGAALDPDAYYSSRGVAVCYS